MPDQAALRAWIDSEWKKRWDAAAAGKKATVWKTDWGDTPLYIYDDMTKAEATALFLLHTEALGLNCWLASVGVRGGPTPLRMWVESSNGHTPPKALRPL